MDYVFDADNISSIEKVGLSIARRDDCFGNGVDEVKVIIKNIPLQQIMTMGAKKDSVKISYKGVDYVKFKDEEFIQQLLDDRMKKLNVLVRFNLNNWMGRESLQCFIEDYELVEDENEDKYNF